MEPWFEELLKVWRDSIDDLAQELLDAYERDPSQRGKWDLETLRQLNQGGIALIPAEYAGNGTEMREAYLESVLPGMFAAGSSLPVTCASTIEMAMRTYPLLMARMTPENREKASDFLCRTWGRYTFDLIRVGLNVLNSNGA